MKPFDVLITVAPHVGCCWQYIEIIYRKRPKGLELSYKRLGSKVGKIRSLHVGRLWCMRQ